MIVLPRKSPERMSYYEVMMRRGNNKEEFTKLYLQAKTGYIGERRLDREWKETDVSGLLFHDFTCFNAVGHSHQMDTIFVCKHFVLVVEVKNVAGRIDFNPQTRQLVRRREDGTVEAFNNPVDQIKRHRMLLEDRFMTLPDYVPVEAAIIITNPSCIIGHVDDEVPIFVVTGLRTKLMEMVKRHENITLNTRSIKSCLEKLYQPHTSQHWRKDHATVRTGVLCTICNGKMTLFSRGFKCLRCNSHDTDNLALRQTLQDYRILYGPEISNEQFRAFAEITSRNTAYAFLARLLPNRKGAGRGSTYLIPEHIHQ